MHFAASHPYLNAPPEGEEVSSPLVKERFRGGEGLARAAPGYTQRRRNAIAKIANDTGAAPAIQSQWTDRPKRGLIVALATIEIPTIATAHVNEDTQLRGNLRAAFPFARFAMVFSRPKQRF